LEVKQVNRKLIRTTLAEVKGRGDNPHPREGGGGGDRREMINRDRGGAPGRGPSGGGPSRDSGGHSGPGGMSAAALGRKKVPPAETNAEIFYYKKQMDAHTEMVIVLLDDEEIEGTIEWYDRNALKINRRGAPNVMLLKNNIKYMYKAEERDGSDSDDDDDRGDDGDDDE
jgi:hypothetical protein